jgi:RNA polymerase sigma-70 factor (ECF subfamily)
VSAAQASVQRNRSRRFIAAPRKSERAARDAHVIGHQSGRVTREESDGALIEAARVGDDAALSMLLARHAPTVMRFATKMCRNDADAEDVLQDTLLAAARGIRELLGGAAMSTWLYAVARSYCIKKRRRSKHAPDVVVPLDAPEGVGLPSEGDAPDAAASRREVGEAIERAIRDLDETSREVIVLRDVEGLSAAETAEVIGIGVDAVKSRLHRARAELRVRLAAYAPHAVATTPSDPACPDIVDVLSRHLEGDIGPDACAAMEAHVARCTSCSAACGSLREAITLCGASGARPLPPASAARMRRVLERVVSSSAPRD